MDLTHLLFYGAVCQGENSKLNGLPNPAADWQPVQGISHLSPYDSWDRLQSHHDPELDKYKKMDGQAKKS